MQDVLMQLGLNQKEAQFYLFLLQDGDKTVSEIAKKQQESRTNAYMILDRLTEEQLVEADDSLPIRRYRAADPSKLRVRLNSQAQQVKQRQSLLQGILPELSSQFSLGQHKPGVVYLEGLAGLKLLLDDIARVETDVLIIASDEAHDDPTVRAVLEKGIAKRRAKDMTTRTVFQQANRTWAKEFQAKGFEARFLFDQPVSGEVVVYGDKIALTVYKPALVTTVITNTVLAQTFRQLFEQLWMQAKP